MADHSRRFTSPPALTESRGAPPDSARRPKPPGVRVLELSRLAILLLAVAALLGLFMLGGGNVLAQTAAGITVNPAALSALTEAAGAAHSASFTVALDAEPGGDVTLTLTHGADVSLDQTTLTFTTTTWITAQTVTVTAVDDRIDEVASEDFSIALSASGGGYGGATAQVTGSVTDDDTATFTATLDKTTLAEADAGVAAGVATLTVTKTSSSVGWPDDRDIGLTLSGSARVGEDFTLTVGDGWTLSKPFILRFAAGATETTAIITVINDAHDDDDETLSIAVDADGAAIRTTGPLTLTLTDDDDPPLKLSALAVTTAATRQMYPAFDADTFHYAVGCETDDAATTGKLTVTLSAADAATRVSVNGVQAANQNGEIELTGLDGYSDVNIVLSDSSGVNTTYTVHCLPTVFSKIVTTKQPGAWDGLLMMGIRSGGEGYIVIIDNNGVPRFHRHVATGKMYVSHFRTHPNGKYPYSYAVQHGVLTDNRNWEQVVLDHDFSEVQRVRTVGLKHTDNHDFVIRENGNYILQAYEPNVRDMTGYTDEEGNPFGSSANVIDAIIQEVTPDGAVVRQVNSWDVFDVEDCQRANGYIHHDWAHINSVQAVGDDYIASYRYCNQALRINARTGKVVWRLGLSKKSDAYWIARDGKAPLKIVGDPYGEFCWQHSARLQPNGHFMLYDNGGSYCAGARTPKQFSRALEYALDLERGEATFVRHHSFNGKFEVFAPYEGIVEVMGNGNWLISWGGSRRTAVTEVIPGPRWSETQGQQLLSVKIWYKNTRFAPRTYPLSPGTLERAWPPGALTEELAESASNSTVHLGASDTVNVVVTFSRPVVDFAANSPSISVKGATVKSVAPHIGAGEAAHAYLFELTPAGDAAVEFELIAGQACADGGICAKDGSTLSTVRTKRSVAAILAVSGLADASLAENTAYGPVTPSVAPTPTGSATWSLEGDDAGDFTINASTGALSMVARDFEAPADADADNVYEVTVRATDTAGRTGARSIEVTVTDADEPPGVPTGLTLSAAIGSLTATWNAGATPAGTTPPATTAYNVQYRLSSDTAWTLLTPSPTAASATIDGLTGGQAYDVQVQAVNPEGRSAWTTHVSGTPTTAGITATPTALGALTEAAGAAHSASFTVALNTQPGGDVTLTLSHGPDVSVDTDPAANGNQATLTFTSANWSSAQTVTVTAVDDSIDEAASEDFSIELSASGGGYDSATAQVTGSVTDDDTATFTATLDKTTLAEADAGGAAGVATLTVTKTSSSVGWPDDRDIGLTLTDNARVGEDFTLTDGDGWTLSKPFILRFAAGATETTAIISVIDDAHDDDDETLSIAVDADGAAIRTTGPLTLTDDDDPPLKLSALAVATAAARQMFPVFAADTFHYAVGCKTDDAQTTGKLTVTLSAADATTRVSVNGVQVANQNGEIELSGLDGYSDVQIVLSDGSGVNTTYTVHCLPRVFPDFETTKQAGAWDGLITMKRGIDSPSMAYIAIVDNNGVPRFHQKVGTNARSMSHFRTHKTGKYPYSYALQHGVIKIPLGGDVYPDLRNYEQVILNDDLAEVERVRTAGLAQTDNHDFVIRENGNYIFLSYEPIVRDFTGYIKRTGDPWGSSAKVKDSIIQETTAAGVKVHEVNSWDLFPLDDCKQGSNGYIDVEWAHVNSLEAVGDDYIASYRRCNQALRINKDTGNVVWRLGLSSKDDAYWTAKDGKAPLKIVGDPYGEFCGQHSARMIANGHILIFDNGGPKCNGPRRPNRFSRVVEYALDLERGTATFVRHHSLRGELDEYAPFQGIIELMDNGNWLISWGGRMDTAVTEVIPGPRWSETQGAEILTVKNLYNGGNAQTRSYPLSPGTLERAWPPGALTETTADSASNSTVHLGASDTVNVVVTFSRPVVDFAANSPSISVTGATVKSVAPHIGAGEAAHAYLFELTPAGDAAVEFELIAGQACADGGICAKDGSTLSTVRTKRSVAAILAVSGLADASLAENTAYGPVTPSVAPTPTGSATWSLEGDDAGDFTINASTGALSMAAQDFEAPADADADNVYEVTVRATDTAGRTGAQSIQVTVNDADEPPGVPAGLTLSAASGSLTATWSAGAAPAGATPPATTAYNVQYRLSSDTAWTLLTPSPTTTSATIDGLTGGSAYDVQVQAVNPEGRSAWTTHVSGTPTTAGITATPTALGALTEAAGSGHSSSFTVALDAQPGGDVTLTLAHGADVSLDQTTLTFTSANWSSAQTVTVTAVDDSIDEAASEDFSIALSASGGGYGSATAQVTGSVTDDDTATLTATFIATPNNNTLAEADAGDAAGVATLTVTITSSSVSWPADRDIGLTLSGSALVGEDFTLTDGDGWTLSKPFILRFGAGATETTAIISVIDDAHDDDDETLSIAVDADGAAIGTAGPLTLTDDDDPPLKLSALAVTTTATRQMYPAFDADTFHYAVGCETDDAQTTGKLTVTLSAADVTTRVSVNGVQVANQNGEIELSGLDGYSDVQIVLSDGSGVNTTYTVHCLPKVFPDFETTKQAGAWDGLITMKRGINSPAGAVIAIIDNNGVPRFHQKMATTTSRGMGHFKKHRNGKYPYSYALQYGVLNTKAGDPVYPTRRNMEQVILREDLTEVERVRTVGLQHTDIHDFVIRANGNYVFLSYETQTHDLTGYIKSSGDAWGSTAKIRDPIIQEVTPQGEVVHEVNGWDLFHLDDCKQGSNQHIKEDWAHLNSLQAVGGDYIGGYRFCNQALRINAQTGNVVWRLGLSTKDDAHWITEDGKAPLKIVGDPYGEFCGQHSARMIANGHILIFDNGGPKCNGPRRPNRFSRVVEYALDLERGTATFVRHHSLRGELDEYAPYQGIIELMDNGNWLISWGGVMDTAVTEVIPGPRWSETQGAEILTVKNLYNGGNAQTRSYPLSPGTLDLAWPPGALTEELADSASNSTVHLGASDTVNVVVAFSRPVVDFDKTSQSISVTGATVKSVAPHIVPDETAHAYLFELTPTGDSTVEFILVTGQGCADGGICAKDGSTLSTVRTKRTVPRALEISGLADASLAENTAYGPVTPSVAPTPTGSATWSLEGDDAGDFTINSGTGALSMVARDFEAPADADADNVYEVTVRVTDTAGRTGVQSIEVTVTDADEPPGVPTGLTLSAASGSLTATWSAGAAPAGATPPATTAYNVQYRLSSDTAWTLLTPSPTTTSATIDGLTGGSAYDVQVQAVNPEGRSAWTTHVSGTPTTAGITATPTALGTLTEAAGSGHSSSFTVALDAQPGGDVTLTLAHGADVSLDQATLTFTSANWNSAQTVTVTAVDDSIDEAASEDFSIALSASGGGYGSATAQVTGSVTDDDTATFTATLDKTTLAEADAGGPAGVATLTVTITNSISWATNRDIGLTLTGSARVGEDFTLTDGDGWTLSKPFILRFGAGATETTAIISVIDDAHDDDAETLSIAVDADGAAIRTVGPLTLTDDDDPPLKLSALAVATAATRLLHPVFAADTFHYAVGCETDDAVTSGVLTLTLSAADATTRVSVNGVQVANQNGEIELTGLDGYSDVKIVLSNASGANTTYTVHCLPKVFPVYETTKQAGAWGGLMTFKGNANDNATFYVVIIDTNGVPRFHRKAGAPGLWPIQFRTHKRGKYPYSYASPVSSFGAGVRDSEQVILNHDLTEFARVRAAGLQHTDVHDFVIRENGNYIFLSYQPKVRDLTGYLSAVNPDVAYGSSETVRDSVIQEQTPQGVKLHEVNSWDLFHLDDCKVGAVVLRDWAHVNSLQAVGNDYIASYKFCHQVLRINKDTGKVVWRLGKSKKSDAYWIAEDGKAPLKIVGDPYGEFCGQHSARVIANNHLLIYDNGGRNCNGDREPGKLSRVVEYALDLEQGTATFVRHHSLRGELSYYGFRTGVIELMDSGNWLISWGSGSDTSVTEVIPGPRWSETQGAEILTVKSLAGGGTTSTRSYPVSPGALDHAWAPGAPEEVLAESASNSSSHLGVSDTVNVVVAFSRPVVDFAANTPSVSVTGATVKSVTPHIVPDETAHAYLFELTPTGDAAVEFELIAGQACAGGGICAKDGSTLSTVRTKRTVPRIMEISGLANASVAENMAYGPVTPSVAPAPTGSATWSLEGDDAGDFTINASTGALSMAARDFETPADADADNVYEVTVRVTDTAGRTDAQSIEVTVTDVNEPPGVPAGLTLSAASGSLTATWSAGAAPAGTTPPATTAYNVQYRLSSDTAWVPLTPGRKDTSATIDGLTGGSTYDVRVRAKNPEDRSAWTVPVSGTPTGAGITVDPQALGVLTEAAGAAHSASFTVALDTQPGGDVTLTLTHSDDVSLDQTTLTFTSANWNSAQTVTVTAVDDSIDEAASEDFSIALSASGGAYDDETAQVTGSVTDDDIATFSARLDKTTIAEVDAGGAAGVATLTVAITNGVSWATNRDIGLTLTGSARVGEDFTLTDGDGWTLSKPFILRFGAGATETTAIISVIDDAHDDDAETLSIAVDADGAAIDTVGPLTLTDNDDPSLKLSALGVTTASDLKMYPAFDADTFHYAVGCETDDAATTGKLTVTLSAADANTRVAVNGVQVASQNGETELTGLDGDSDVIISLSNSAGASTTYTVHCLPKVFLNFVTTKQPGAWEGLITISGWNVPGNAPPYIAIIDNNGVPRFHREVATNDNWVIQFRTHKKGKYPYSYAVQHGVSDYDRNYEQVVLDHDLTEVARIRTAGLQQTDSHDFVIRENGNYVLLAYEPNVRNMTGYTDMEGNPFGGSANVIDSIIQEVTPAGQQVHIVNSWDVLDLDDCKQGRNGPIHDDYAHINSVQVVGGDYITSYRHCSQALRINAQTGKVVWRLGLSRKSDAYWIARDGRAPLKIVGDPYGEFCGQHSPRMIANGNLILFDNGGRYCNGARKPKQFSRAVEYALDLERGTATFVRHHFLGGAPDTYAVSRGIIELMDNGNWLLSWGTKLEPAVTEVIPGPRGSETQGQQLLSVKLSYPDTSIQTRAYPLSPGTLDKAWPPDPPEELIAESAYNSTVHLGASDTVNVVVAFSRPVVDFAANTPSVSVTGATVKSVTPHIVPDETAHAYLFELTPAGDSTVEFVLVTGQACAAGGICAKDGSTLSTVRTKRSVPRIIMEISGLADVSVAENTAYGPVTPAVTPTPTGSDTWSLEGDDAGDFTIDASTGALSMVAQDFEAPADADGDNVYEVTVRVSDGANSATVALLVTVRNMFELFPAILGPTSFSYAENGALRASAYSVTSPEDQGGAVWSLSGTDSGDFSIEDGILRFVFLPDYESPSDDDLDTAYTVTVTASDGDTPPATRSRDVTVTVTNEEEPGVVTLSPLRPRAGMALTASLTDPDGSTSGVAWSWERSTGPTTWAAIDGADSSSYTPVAADAGAYLRATVTYTDGHGAGKSARRVSPYTPLTHGLSALSVTGPARGMYPAFDPEVLHYAMECVAGQTTTLTLSAAGSSTRVAVNGIQRRSQNAVVELTGLAGDSDILITLSDGQGGATTYVLHCFGEDFPNLVTTKGPGATEELILFSLHGQTPDDSKYGYLMIVDNNGVPRIHRRIANRVNHFRPQNSETYPFSYSIPFGPTRDVWILTNRDLTDLDQVTAVSPLTKTDRHDFFILDNGDFTFLSYEPMLRDLSFLTDREGNSVPVNPERVDGKYGMRDTAIQIRTPSGVAKLTWYSWDHVVVQDCDVKRIPDDDYAHGNSLWMDNGVLVVSFRGCSKVLGVDESTGEVVWRLGRSYRNPEEWGGEEVSGDGRGSGPAPLTILNDPYGEFCKQHSAQILDNGHLLLYDNGVECVRDPATGRSKRTSDVFSRAVEYAIDPDNGEATFLRHHSLHGAFNRMADSGGLVQLMENGDWLISWGRGITDDDPTTALPPDESVTQVDPATGAEKFSINVVLRQRQAVQVRAYPLSPVALAKAPGPLEEQPAVSASNSNAHLGTSDMVNVVVAFSRPVVDFAANSPSIRVTGATVKSVEPHIAAGEAAHAYLFELTPAGDGAVEFVLVAGQACADGGICAKDGSTLSTVRTRRTVPRAIVPDAPTSLTATANGQTQIDLSWTAPISDGGATITGYKIEVSTNTGTTWTELVSDSGSATTTHEHTGLTAGTTRRYRVSAINSAGTGAASNVASATTGSVAPPPPVTSANTAPEAVDDLAATSAGASAINLMWTAPGNGGSAITGYRLERKTVAGSYAVVSSNIAANATSYADSSLSAGTAYTYRIRAVNAVGNGGWSSDASATTANAENTAPETVDDLAATSARASAINLTWTAPGNGGSAITGYSLERKTGAGSYTVVSSSIAANATSYADTSLSAGTAYTYRIRAVNAVGNGGWSNDASATTGSVAPPPPVTSANTAPEAVDDLAATSAGASAINLMWTAPGNGGSAITGYRLERKTVAGSYAVVSSNIAANATSYADSSLSAGTAYTYRMRAVNAVGNGGWSNDASATTGNVAPPPPITTANTAPEAVDDLAATSAGASAINLMWTAPGNGGSAITGYRLERKTVAGSYAVVSSNIAANATSYADSSLSAGTAYTYRMRAVNAVGNGGWSNEAGATTANAENTAPETVDDLAATSAGASVVNLTWTAPGNGGSAITGYRLERKTGAGSYTLVSLNIAANATSYADSSLSAGTAYTYRIRAVNAVGNGGWSNEAGATTGSVANTAPEAVDDLAATSAGASAINLTWTAPGNGGSAITGYRLERKTGAGSYAVVSSSIAANATSYADTSLSAGTTYTYRIRAVNAVGNGGWSNEASATTGSVAPPPPVTPPGGGIGGGAPENQGPVFIDRPKASRSVPEGTSEGASFGDPLAATDLDNDALTYSLRGGDADSFDIDRQTGQLLVKAALDYETKASYSLQARVVDGRGGSDTIDLTVMVTDVDEPPAIAGPVAIEYKEDSLHAVAVATAIDPEGSEVSWSLTGDDAGAFTVSDAGVLAFNAPPDYEAPADADTDNVYQVTLQATDLKGMTGILPMVVTVTDVENDGIWTKYDSNNNGLIERGEAVNAAFDYFKDLITKQQALEVVILYFAS